MTSVVLTSHRPDGPASGMVLRNWQNIRCLGLLGPVDVVSVGVDGPARSVDGVRDWVPFAMRQRSWRDRVRTRCWLLRPGVYRGIDRQYMGQVVRWVNLRARQHRYDVAVVEGLSLASYIAPLRRAGCVVVFDAHNVETVLYDSASASAPAKTITRRMKDWIVGRRFCAEERRAVTNADLVWACSDHDARLIREKYPEAAPVAVVPNGVDVDAYQATRPHVRDDDWATRPITLVYPGLFSYEANEDAAIRLITDVLPAIRARGYAARVVLVGREPTPAMREAARADAAIEITGPVPSVTPYLQQPCIVTLPITVGSGTRLKIVEAFAAGAPVVSTAKGAEGIDAVDGEHLLIRDSAGEMASAAIELWSRPVLRASLCANALGLVRRRYSWSAATERIARSLGIHAMPHVQRVQHES